MGTVLGITILIILLSLIGYIVFLIRQHRELKEIRRSIPMGAGNFNGRAIIEVPTYKETKSEMSRLRSALDGALDIYGQMRSRPNGETQKSNGLEAEFLEERVSKLAGAIVDLRQAAEALLAAVERRPHEGWQENSKLYNVSRKENSEPSDPDLVVLRARSLETIGEKLNLVGPSIAGCYFAMSEAEENAIVQEVAGQVQNIIDNIDDALLALREDEL